MDKPKVTMMSRDELKAKWEDEDDDEIVGCISGYEFERLEEENLDVPVVENLDAEILKAIERGGELDMSDWHNYEDVFGSDDEERVRQAVCGTTHCRAGWAVHLAGEAGIKLESATDAESAGALIYFASTGSVPDFYAETESAMRDIRRCAGVEP